MKYYFSQKTTHFFLNILYSVTHLKTGHLHKIYIVCQIMTIVKYENIFKIAQNQNLRGNFTYIFNPVICGTNCQKYNKLFYFSKILFKIR